MRLELFCPHQVVESLVDVDLDDLYQQGIRGLVLDLDNTIVPWQSEEISPERVAWIMRAKERFRVCILSNTIFGRRMRRIANRLGVSCLSVWHIDRKPRQLGFTKALNLLGTTGKETAMIGDQLLADVVGGRRCGMYCCWVRPISRGEFFVTRIARMFERAVVRRLSKDGLLPDSRRRGGTR
jgi:uncharacterized protein